MNENKTAIDKMVEELECLIVSTEGDNYTEPSESWRGYCNALDLARRLAAEERALEASQAEKDKGEDIEDYDAGLLNDYGGGNVGWWQDYIHNVLAACNEHWRETLTRHEKGVK